MRVFETCGGVWRSNEQCCYRKPSLPEPSESPFSLRRERASRLPRRVGEAANTEDWRQEPEASWPDSTASEQIPPSLQAQKQLQNPGGPSGEASACRGRSGSEEEGSRGEKNLATDLPGTICLPKSTEDCVPGPGRQSVGICQSQVKPQTTGKSKQHRKAAEL